MSQDDYRGVAETLRGGALWEVLRTLQGGATSKRTVAFSSLPLSVYSMLASRLALHEISMATGGLSPTHLRSFPLSWIWHSFFLEDNPVAIEGHRTESKDTLIRDAHCSCPWQLSLGGGKKDEQ